MVHTVISLEILSEVGFRDLFGTFLWQNNNFFFLNPLLYIDILLYLEMQHQTFCSILMCIPTDLPAIFQEFDII